MSIFRELGALVTLALFDACTSLYKYAQVNCGNADACIRSTAPYFVPQEASDLPIYLRNTLHDEEGLLWTGHPFNLTDMRTHIAQ